MSSTAYFATGCFWGAERRFWQMAGVLETSVGYMGGVRLDPTYEQICTGLTGHAEMVQVVFDPDIISFHRCWVCDSSIRMTIIAIWIFL